MCVVSMISDHYINKWQDQYTGQWEPTVIPYTPSLVTPEEVAEFKSLLEKARQYDLAHNEPNCQLEDKKVKLRAILGDLAKEIEGLLG